MQNSFRRLRTVLLCGIATYAGATAFAQSLGVQQAFQRGVAALHEGRNQDAEREFRKVTQLNPTLPEGYLDLGLVLGREGKISEAVETVQKSLTLNPQLDSAHLYLGIFEYQLGQSEPAICDLRQELDRHPKSAEALSWLGIIELAAGRPELAVGPLDTAFEQSPDDLNLLEYRGRAHSQVAQASYARMAQLSPDAWQVHKVRGELFAADHKDRDAITEYQAALAKETGNPDLYEALGDAYRRLDELDLAQKAYARELELTPQNPIAMYNLGSVEIDRGDYVAGIALLRTMNTQYPGTATAEFYLGRGLAETNQDAEAAQILEKSAQQDATGEIAKRSFYQLTRVYRKLQKPEDERRALAAYNRLRVQEEARKTQTLADWRKIDGPAYAPNQPARP